MRVGPPPDARHAGPFTTDWLREKMQLLANKYSPPPDHELAHIVSLLNMIDGVYKARETATTNQARAAEVNYAFWILMRFFDARRRACESAGIDRQIIENEQRLCDRFDGLKEMMAATPFELEMDAGLRTRPPKSWRNFAHWIARAFQWGLQDSNPERKPPIGFSDDGPVVRLTMEAFDVIAGGDLKLRPKNRKVLGQHLRAHL
jgi:hypothetical protein